MKLELDQEAVDSLKAAQHEARMIGVQKQAKPVEEGDGGEEAKSAAGEVAANYQAHKTNDSHTLPGEL